MNDRKKSNILKFALMLILLALLGSASVGANQDELELLDKHARHSLSHCIIQIEDKSFMVAGPGHYHSLWTRDAAYAARGLLLIDRSDIVRSQLSLILSHQTQDGRLPKVLDSMNPEDRVIRAAGRYFFGQSQKRGPPITSELIPLYEDRLGSKAIDSNLLVILAATHYLEQTSDLQWWDEHLPKLVKAFRNYDDLFKNTDTRASSTDRGLIHQPAYSDWQDSTARIGTTFLTNLLFWITEDRLMKIDPAQFDIDEHSHELLKIAIFDRFYSDELGVFMSMSHGKQVSLDGNLFAIEHGFLGLNATQRLYQRLKGHPLWAGKQKAVGTATTPNYRYLDHPLHIRAAFISNYHDSMYWSWLMAYAGKIATLMGDTRSALAQLDILNQLAERDQGIHETYDPTPGLPPMKRVLARSEHHFGWGSAFVIDFLDTLKKHLNE